MPEVNHRVAAQQALEHAEHQVELLDGAKELSQVALTRLAEIQVSLLRALVHLQFAWDQEP